MPQPDPVHDLHFDAPIRRWDEALPLGNGLTGALVWGDGAPLRISLDRADLWDLRPVPEWEHPDCNYATMRRWVAEGRIEDLHRLYSEPYDKRPAPTKIPAGRIELRLPAVQGSRLRLGDATAEVELEGGRHLDVMVCGTAAVGYIRLLGHGEDPVAQVVAPAFSGPGAAGTGPEANSLTPGALSALGYPPAQPRAAGTATGFLQEGWGGFAYAIALATRSSPEGPWEAAWSIATNREAPDPWQLAATRAEHALARGWAAHHQHHAAWWAAHWNRSTVSLPHSPTLERQWALETYKLGAAARRGAPPISLQAVWTADEGTIPPWKGDYHHDLNTQLSYWPCYTGNRLEGGLGFLDWLWETRAAARDWTRMFWALPGLNVPMTSDLAGRQMGGWEQYTCSATTAAWLAEHFYLHWRYSRDRVFLADRAYPYLSEVCTFLEAVTETGPDGRRFLPLSASPEIFDNRLEAWMTPTTNYDLALIRWALGAAAELAQELSLPEDAARWQGVLATLPDLGLAPDGHLLVAPGLTLPESHRHFSHLMAIHPLGLRTWEGGDAHRRTIQAAIAELERLGPDLWCGYSYAWFASLAARAKDGTRAERALQVFARAFCSPNSFHLNGDQTASGHSRFTYRPFTLEGNFAAGAAIQEMLLQSYGGVVRVFPAVPPTWTEAAFTTLRADGAFLVSARREGGRTVEVRIESEAGGHLVMEDPFGKTRVRVESGRTAVEAQDGVWVGDMPQGAVVTWRA